MPSLTISIDHEDSYELATELVLALQESKALVKPVSSAQISDFRTTLDIPDLQFEVRDRITREASKWANVKGLKSSSTEGIEDSATSNLSIS